MVNYQIVEPFPEELLKAVSLRSAKEMRVEELRLKDKAERIRQDRISLIEEVSELIKKTKLSKMLEKVLKTCNIIQNMDINFLLLLIQKK